MLYAKNYRNFKGYESCLLIIGDAESYKKAAAYFSARNIDLLTSNQYISIENSLLSEGFRLFLNKQENKSFVQACEKLAQSKSPAHEYLNSSSAPDLEIILSCGEYDHLPE